MQVSSFRPPSGVNGAASAVARKAVPGQRAGTPHNVNRDRYDLATIRRGHTVRFGASLGLVHRVSKGLALVHYASGVEQWDSCSRLEVVRHLGRVRLA